MTFAETIARNCAHVQPGWWPRYAYHYTDLINAVSILTSGHLYSRIQADSKGLMRNDNASRQVIDMTSSRATSYVRFYFRPLTPTQYHNEGYKHPAIRYCGDENANVPVPIFFLFDLEKLLSRKETCFSALTQAGHGNPLQSGEEAFAALPFEQIYSSGAADRDTLKYRHAELLFPVEYPIDESLRCIYCRNECERATFLNYLRLESPSAFAHYQNSIRVAGDGLFQRNGLFVESVSLHDNIVSFSFADTPEKRDYARRYNRDNQPLTLEANFVFEWLRGIATVSASFADVRIDYLAPRTIAFKLPNRAVDADTLRVALRIGGQLLCLFEQPLSSYELM